VFDCDLLVSPLLNGAVAADFVALNLGTFSPELVSSCISEDSKRQTGTYFCEMYTLNLDTEAQHLRVGDSGGQNSGALQGSSFYISQSTFPLLVHLVLP
jgi:hypothetical protein